MHSGLKMIKRTTLYSYSQGSLCAEACPRSPADCGRGVEPGSERAARRASPQQARSLLRLAPDHRSAWIRDIARPSGNPQLPVPVPGRGLSWSWLRRGCGRRRELLAASSSFPRRTARPGDASEKAEDVSCYRRVIATKLSLDVPCGFITSQSLTAINKNAWGSNILGSQGLSPC